MVTGGPKVTLKRPDAVSKVVPLPAAELVDSIVQKYSQYVPCCRDTENPGPVLVCVPLPPGGVTAPPPPPPPPQESKKDARARTIRTTENLLGDCHFIEASLMETRL